MGRWPKRFRLPPDGEQKSRRPGRAALPETRAAEIFIAGRRAAAFDGDIGAGNAKRNYEDDYVRRWIKSRGFTLRSPTTTVKMSMAEAEKRMKVPYENLARAERVLFPHAEGVGAYDHAPSRGGGRTGEILAQRETKMGYCKDDVRGAKDRRAIVIFAWNNGVRARAEMLFRGSDADGSRAADFDPKEVPANPTVTFAPRATCTAECSESMMERKFSVMPLRSFAVEYRLLLVDQ